MKTTRRKFVQNSVVAGAGLTLSHIPLVHAEATEDLRRPESSARRPSATLQGEAAFTRGVGIYPGAPSEDFGPHMTTAGMEYRNLALHRPAYQSSAYDYNLTAQLVTDGIRHTEAPSWFSASVDGRALPKHEREILIDHFPPHTLDLGTHPVLEMHLGGGRTAPAVDLVMVLVAVPKSVPLASLQVRLSTSKDDRLWRLQGSVTTLQGLSGEGYPADFAKSYHLLSLAFPFSERTQPRFYRIEFGAVGNASLPAEMQWKLGQVEFYSSGERVQVGGPYGFKSAWKSATAGEEWVYVDLGSVADVELVRLHWIARAAEGVLEISDDANAWRVIHRLGDNAALEEIRLAPGVRARYVRAHMMRPATSSGYELSEMEVFGRGGMRPQPKPAATDWSDGRLELSGGRWRLMRGDDTAVQGMEVASSSFDDSAWLPATVPGTVLASYLNAGAIPDPNYGQNQLYISDSYFYADFWYRTEFASPVSAVGELVWIEFAGLNWKADVFLNGKRLGRVDGGFTRARFDVTNKLRSRGKNTLAVCVLKNATPGSAKQKTLDNAGKNGGALGAGNPTFHASIGWDWIPTIRGRNTGLWGAVALCRTTPVTLEDPVVQTKLTAVKGPHAEVTVSVVMRNHAAEPARGVLRGKLGAVQFERVVTIAGGASQTLSFDPRSHSQMLLADAQLWWPNGYGEPYLHDVKLQFHSDVGALSKPLCFKVGLREVTSSEVDGALRMWINGKRFIVKGGNWGFGESMLRYREREYDAAIRYHREMNFNTIRNWVGQVPDDAFYEACDRHGIVVWQDFWLANPWDGPDPVDELLFLANAGDLVRRIRLHACVGLYCGRNEGFPPASLERGLRKLLAECHADVPYISSSADGAVSGHGPYHALSPENYFRIVDPKLHSEIGAPAIPTIESVRSMMPESALWPQGLEWGLHDFCLHGAQGCSSFRSRVDEDYGGAENAADWIALAHFVTYDAYRAIFEAQNRYRMGVLLWMSHPCWPSFVWQTYDYYLAPTAAYFACKKAAEPLHIQWNSLAETVEVVNCSASGQRGLVATLEIIDMNGKVLATQTSMLDAAEDSVASAFVVDYPSAISDVHFLRLALVRGAAVVSSNFYLRGRERGNHQAIRQLKPARIRTTLTTERRGETWNMSVELRNTSASPALMVQMRVVRERSGDRILPAIFEDNFIALMPGERRSVAIEVRHVDTRGERPSIALDGFNLHRESMTVRPV